MPRERLGICSRHGALPILGLAALVFISGYLWALILCLSQRSPLPPPFSPPPLQSFTSSSDQQDLPRPSPKVGLLLPCIL